MSTDHLQYSTENQTDVIREYATKRGMEIVRTFADWERAASGSTVATRVGIQVVCCAEQFENDGSPVSTIVTGVKRAMAGEYSRELSAKVFKGQCKPIGLRRIRVSCP